MSDPPVLLDNVVLSNFLLVEGERVLEARLGGRMQVTPEVLSENAAGRVAGHTGLARVDGLLSRGILEEVAMTRAERARFNELLASLGRGEASCIAVAQQRGAVVASDDRVARQAASARGIPVTGTVGILVAAVRSGVLEVERADAMLGAMIAIGFFAPVRSLRGLV